MPDAKDITFVLNDPGFHGLQPWDRKKVVDTVLSKDEKFGALPDTEQAKARNVIYSKARVLAPKGVPTAEQETLQESGPDVPVRQFAAKHPYITSAALGAAFPPAEIGGLAGAGLGALEQMGITKAAQVAGEINPYLGLAVGMGAPMVTGKIARGLTAVPKRELAAASKAAENAAQETWEKAPEQFYEHGQAVKKAGEQAAEAGTKAAQRAAKGTIEEAEAVAPAQAQAAMTTAVGGTAAESQSRRTLPPDQFAAYRTGMRQSVYGPINRISDELGAQYEAATEGKLANPANLDETHNTLASENKWLDERGMVASRPVRALMDEIKPSVPDYDTLHLQLLSGTAGPALQSRFRKLLHNWEKANSYQEISPEVLEQIVKQVGGEGGSATVGDLMGWRSRASALVRSTEGHDQAVAMQLRDAFDKSLVDSGVEIPKELQERWGAYKSVFDKGFRRSVATSADPIKYAGKIFEEPQRALQLMKGATDTEKGSLRQLFADYAHEKAGMPLTLGKKVNPEVLKTMVGEGPYTQLKPWLETEPKAMAWEQATADPSIGKLSQQAFADEVKKISEDQAKAITESGIKLAKKLGPAGRGKLAKILAVKDPVEAAKVVEREFPISPEGAQKLYQQAQITPGQKAFQSVAEAKELEKGLDINAAKEDAAVQRLMAGMSNDTKAMIKRRLQWHGAMALASTIAGHGIGYQGGISAMLLSMLGANKIRQMFRPMTTNPEAMTEYWRAIQMRPNKLNATSHGRFMARALLAATNPPSEGEDEGQ